MPPRKKPPPSTPKNGSLFDFFGRAASASSTGSPVPRKRKADVGSAADPVVISDEDEPAPKAARRASFQGKEKQMFSPTRNKVEQGSDAEEAEAEEVLVAECMMCGMRLPPDSVVSYDYRGPADSSPRRRTSTPVWMPMVTHQELAHPQQVLPNLPRTHQPKRPHRRHRLRKHQRSSSSPPTLQERTPHH